MSKYDLIQELLSRRERDFVYIGLSFMDNGLRWQHLIDAEIESLNLLSYSKLETMYLTSGG